MTLKLIIISCIYFGFVGPAIPPVVHIYFDTGSVVQALFALIMYPIALLFGGLLGVLAGLIYIGIFLFVIKSRSIKFKVRHEGDLLLVGLISSIICILVLFMPMELLEKEFNIKIFVSLFVAPVLFCGLSFPLIFRKRLRALLNIVDVD